jgi:histidine triad (HIT) family protein
VFPSALSYSVAAGRWWMVAAGDTAHVTACTFCDVVAGELVTEVVLADPVVVAFLDHRPVFKGHVLVVPRDHVSTLADLPTADIGPFFTRVQHVAVGVQEAMGADGTFVAMNNVVSQSVAHFHVHVVPRRWKDGLRGFFWPRVRYESAEEMADVAARVRNALK